MIWFLLFLVAALIATAHWWEPPPNKPLPRQPSPHYTVFANRAAVHEAGHTVAAWCCTLVPSVDRVSIETATGGVTEYTHYDEDSSEGIWCCIVINLAGLAAEISAWGKMRSGECESDLQKALKNAKKLVEDGSIKPPWKITPRSSSLKFEKIFQELDEVHGQILSDGYHMAHAILEAHGNRFHKVVSILLTKKTVKSEDLEPVLGKRTFIKIAGLTSAAGWARPTFIFPIQQA